MKLPVIHTWRDGVFIYQDQIENNPNEMGAPLVVNREGLNSLLEIRHLKGDGIGEIGHVFIWKRARNAELKSTLLGSCRQQDLKVFLPDEYKI